MQTHQGGGQELTGFALFEANYEAVLARIQEESQPKPATNQNTTSNKDRRGPD